MPDFARLSISEIQQKYLIEKLPLTPAALRQLRKDPRQGVRQLHRRLQQTRDAGKAESQRVERLLYFERLLWKSGLRYVAGVDEVGVGPLAGPVVAAAVIFPPDVFIAGIDDSKKLDAETRTRLAGEINRCALAVHVAEVPIEEIDSLNIYHASVKAMRIALEQLPIAPQHVLVDARDIPGVACPQNKFNKGDGLCFSIAAASILAKTHRDQLMERLDGVYPGYGFASHKGYCTREHQDALARLGPCPIHRKSFLFINEVCGEFSPFFYQVKDRIAGAATARQLAEEEASLGAFEDQFSEYERRKLRALINRMWNKFEH